MNPVLCILDDSTPIEVLVPLAPVRASCGFTGFPSPAQDYTEEWVNLVEYLGIKKPNTWLFRAEGESLKGIGIENGDILVVDARAKPQLGSLCICTVDGEMVAKGVDMIDGKPHLISANPDYPPLAVEEVVVFGVVTGRVTRFEGVTVFRQ